MNQLAGREVMGNMEFLVGELKKEWDKSGENKAFVVIRLEDTDLVHKKIAGRIALYQKGIVEADLSFEEAMLLTRKNYILLRMIKKIREKEEKVNNKCMDDKFKVLFDAEENDLYKELFE